MIPPEGDLDQIREKGRLILQAVEDGDIRVEPLVTHRKGSGTLAPHSSICWNIRRIKLKLFFKWRDAYEAGNFWTGPGRSDVFADIVKLGKKYGVTEYEIWPCNAGADWDYREGSLDDVKRRRETRACISAA